MQKVCSVTNSKIYIKDKYVFPTESTLLNSWKCSVYSPLICLTLQCTTGDRLDHPERYPVLLWLVVLFFSSASGSVTHTFTFNLFQMVLLLLSILNIFPKLNFDLTPRVKSMCSFRSLYQPKSINY